MTMKTEILLINCQADHSQNNAMDNKGGEAINTATLESLREVIPDANFCTFMLLSKDFAKKIGITIIPSKITYKFKPFSLVTSFFSTCDVIRSYLWSCFKWDSLICNQKLKTISDADVVVHVGGDLYSDDYGLRTIIEHSKDFLMCHYLGKPVAIYAESIGPFNSYISSSISRFALNRVDLITVREGISRDNLLKLGIRESKVHLTADPAFLFKPVSKEKVTELLKKEGVVSGSNPIFGVTTGNTNFIRSAKKSRKMGILKSLFYLFQYLLPEKIFLMMLPLILNNKSIHSISSSAKSSNEMSRIVDHCIENYNATVLLIPHVVPLKGAIFDDRKLLKEIYDRCRNKEKVILIGDYAGDELKGIIGSCDMFIGAKMHATIAATSQFVPTIAIAFGHKFYGVFGLLGLEKYVCDSFSVDNITQKIDEVWMNRSRIQDDLKEKMEHIREMSLMNALLVKKLL